MQIIITLKNDGIVAIPVNYNYYVQSAIFKTSAQSDSDFAEHFHDVADGGKTKYKFFTFGELRGKNHYHSKKLYYEGDIRLEIRSASDEFIKKITNALSENGSFCIGEYSFSIKDISVQKREITESLIKVRTLSPIVSKRQTADNKAEYYSPQDVRFISRSRETFESKYEAFYGEKPESSIDVMTVAAGRKVVTDYKDTWITAYHGVFQLYGKPEYLQFLYDVGLGIKTSQGFGMFEIIE